MSRFRRSPARQITVIQTDGTVIRTTDSTARLSDLIAETLDSHPGERPPAADAPVEITLEDTPPLPEDVSLALLFARKAS